MWNGCGNGGRRPSDVSKSMSSEGHNFTDSSSLTSLATCLAPWPQAPQAPQRHPRTGRCSRLRSPPRPHDRRARHTLRQRSDPTRQSPVKPQNFTKHLSLSVSVNRPNNSIAFCSYNKQAAVSNTTLNVGARIRLIQPTPAQCATTPASILITNPATWVS